MSDLLRAQSNAARRRILLVAGVAGAGIALALAAIAMRAWGTGHACAVVVLVLAASLLAALPRWRRHDIHWVVATLDAARPDLEDSAALLLAEHAQLRPLQQLQQRRVAQRLRDAPGDDLRPQWPWRGIAAIWVLAAVTVAAMLAWPRQQPGQAFASAPTAGAVSAAAASLQSAMLEIEPPAYTAQAPSRVTSLDAKAPEGSRLDWTLRFSRPPGRVELVPHAGAAIALRRDGDDWRARATLSASMLYRVVVDGVPLQARLHRIDAVRDEPPKVFLRQPEHTLTLVDRLPASWPLVFEAEDDHGVAADALLVITRSEGTGENIRFHETSLRLRGDGERRHKRFQARIVPSAYGVQRGEDLVARLEVRDNRAPVPQASRSASAILRWPEARMPGAEGLDALARQVLPAYFRSQRQIIIDAEALLKERPRLQPDAFAARSDSIGVDQRLLRLRYGQFLGEESEGGAHALPTSDLPTSDASGEQPREHPQADDHGHDDDGADGVAAGEAGGFGQVPDVLEAFGHTHDIPEAATLLDPQTRETLRKALREMWQSELHLRQAAPQQALPYAHRALEFIKQVQQAERIYLQRVGSQLPPIDESRRLGGKRDGIERRALAPAPARESDPLRIAWRALDDGVPTTGMLEQLQRWAERSGDRVDPLSLIAAVESLRADPSCEDCRQDLRRLLWSAMSQPDGAIGSRSDGGEAGRRYLEALDAASGDGR